MEGRDGRGRAVFVGGEECRGGRGGGEAEGLGVLEMEGSEIVGCPSLSLSLSVCVEIGVGGAIL